MSSFNAFYLLLHQKNNELNRPLIHSKKYFISERQAFKQYILDFTNNHK